jgi:drug/metabolite transporter (DMT)-like permease
MLLLDRWQTGVGKFSPQIIAGLVIGLLGVGVLMSGKLFTTSSSAPIDVIGSFMVLASCILWSVGGILGRRVSQPPHPLASSAFQMIAGGLMLLAASTCFEAWKPIGEIPWNDSAWMAWLYLAVFGSMIGFTAFVWLLHHVSAASVSTYAYVNPLVAIVLGWLFLNEQPGLRTAVATVFILGGVVVIQLARRSAGRAQVTTVARSDSLDK